MATASEALTKHTWNRATEKNGEKQQTITSCMPEKPDDSVNRYSESQQQSEHKRTPRLRYLVCDTWFYEILALCISIVCLIAIGAILKAYDQ